MPAGRYVRQIAAWGEEAQARLASSSALVVGLGGLGSAASLYLAAAGVGKLVLADHDEVEESDLNRQVLHWTSDIGRPKVESAAEKLRRLNPEVEVEVVRERLSSLKRALELVKRADVVVDCLDNWPSRFLLNRACIEVGRPLVHAAVEVAAGWLTVVKPGEGPCLRCTFPRAPGGPEPPIVGPVPGVFGSLEALEALKLLTGFGRPLVGKLLYYDASSGAVEIFATTRNPACPACGR